jgi:hypothetical protein
VERELSIVRDTYTALYNDAANSRGEILEAAIVLLIPVDIVIALLVRGSGDRTAARPEATSHPEARSRSGIPYIRGKAFPTAPRTRAR